MLLAAAKGLGFRCIVVQIGWSFRNFFSTTSGSATSSPFLSAKACMSLKEKVFVGCGCICPGDHPTKWRYLTIIFLNHRSLTWKFLQRPWSRLYQPDPALSRLKTHNTSIIVLESWWPSSDRVLKKRHHSRSTTLSSRTQWYPCQKCHRKYRHCSKIQCKGHWFHLVFHNSC